MLIAEYDYQMDLEVQREEAFRIGRSEGIDIGRSMAQEELNRKDEQIRSLQERLRLLESQD